MNDAFHLRQNLRNFHAFATDVPRNNCMLNPVVYRANQLWETLPLDLKNSYSIELFKNNRMIKKPLLLKGGTRSNQK